MKNTLDAILEKILVILLAIMLLSVLWQVFSRFVLQDPSTVTDEITSFSLVWIGLLGAAYVTGQKLHLAIDLLPAQRVENNRLLYDGIVHFSIFAFAFIVMIIGGMWLSLLSFQFGQTSAALEIPLGIIYLMIPISGLLTCYYSMYLFFQIKKA